jgi:hypothetical protein
VAVFLTVDPITSSTNEPYGYSGQDPINNYDLAGKLSSPTEEGGGDEAPPITLPGEPLPPTIEPPTYYGSIGMESWAHAWDDFHETEEFHLRLRRLGYTQSKYFRLGGAAKEGLHLGSDWIRYPGARGAAQFNPDNRAVVIVRPDGRWNMFRVNAQNADAWIRNEVDTR